ncbi:MAG: carboxypeptidase-like regulatory domain-containing protein [Saprospiraceae bacterium]|nr:carboxypeptidase-like regulatory domain-containing protein [Saprospiraceae bacterium]
MIVIYTAQQQRCFWLALWVIIIFSHHSIAQELVGKVIQHQTKTPIAYAHVGWIGKNKGTISNSKGSFRLPSSDIQQGDTLRVSVLGYESAIWVCPKELPLDSIIITLTPREYILPAVTLWATSKKQQIGSDRDISNEMVWGAGGLPSGEELGRVFLLQDKERVVLDSFHVNLKYNGKDSLYFRLNVYEWREGQPLRASLQEEIRFWICPAKDQTETDWYHIPLGDYNIRLEHDFMASLELLRHSVSYGYSPIFISVSDFDQPAPWRQTAQADWSQLRDYTLAFSFSIQYE